MTKTSLLKGLAAHVGDSEHGDWEVTDWLFERGYNCVKVDSYVEEANDKGYEQWEVYMVESYPYEQPFLHFHFAIAWQGGYWGEPPAVLEVNPYVTTRYRFVKNWTDDE